MNITLNEATMMDLPVIHEIEQGLDTQKFIFGYSLEAHEKAFTTSGVTYLKILVDETVVGFFILFEEPECDSVEFRRVAIREQARGIGQLALLRMEEYCRSVLGCRRIWLDVMASNLRAKHIYQKLGYRCFNRRIREGQELLFYEKYLLG